MCLPNRVEVDHQQAAHFVGLHSHPALIQTCVIMLQYILQCTNQTQIVVLSICEL